MLFLVTYILLFCTFLTFYLWYRYNFSYWSRHKTVPSVEGKIFSGNFFNIATLKTHYGFHLKTIYDDPKFKNEAAVGIFGLHKPTLLVRDPQLVKSILIKDFDCFAQRYAEPDENKDPIGNLALVFARYTYWKDMRSKLTPFFSSAKLKQIYPLIQEVGKSLDAHLKRRGKRFVAEVKDISTLFTIDVSSTTIFGMHADCLNDAEQPINIETRSLMDFSWTRALNHLCIFFMPKMTGVLGAQVFKKKTNLFIRSTISKAMEQREKSGLVRNDLIDIFLKLKKEAEANGQDMQKCNEGFIAQAAIFWIGGYETSSSVISHSLMELAKQPELLEKLRSEIFNAFVEGEGHISYESIHKLEFLDMIVHETMRMYPLLPFLDRKFESPPGRKSSYNLRPYYDFTLPEGMPVYIPVYCIHYDEKFWPNPTKFDPDRFSPSNKGNIVPMTYLPFGEGQRNCIGSRLGLLQVKVGLIHFLKDHHVRVCDQTTMKPEFDPKAIVVQIKGGIYLEVLRDDMCQNARSEKQENI